MTRHTESQTVNAILQYLTLRGIPAWRMNSGAFSAASNGKTRFHRFGVKGMSDIIGCLPWQTTQPIASGGGRFFAIEVKSATGKPTVDQTLFMTTVTRAGGRAFVARSVADVQEALGL